MRRAGELADHCHGVPLRERTHDFRMVADEGGVDTVHFYIVSHQLQKQTNTHTHTRSHCVVSIHCPFTLPCLASEEQFLEDYTPHHSSITVAPETP